MSWCALQVFNIFFSLIPLLRPNSQEWASLPADEQEKINEYTMIQDKLKTYRKTQQELLAADPDAVNLQICLLEEKRLAAASFQKRNAGEFWNVWLICVRIMILCDGGYLTCCDLQRTSNFLSNMITCHRATSNRQHHSQVDNRPCHSSAAGTQQQPTRPELQTDSSQGRVRHNSQ